ncbi:hypothetical protein AKJ16_DCAP12550 [Drosera capensis]
MRIARSEEDFCSDKRIKRAIHIGNSQAGRVFPQTTVSNGEASKHRSSGGGSCSGSGFSGFSGEPKEKESPLSATKSAASDVRSSKKKSVERKGNVFDYESVRACLMDQSRSPIFEKNGEGSKQGGERRRSSVNSHKLQLAEYVPAAAHSVAKSQLIETMSNATAENMDGAKRHLKDVRNSLTVSKELVKVLFRILREEEGHSSGMTLVSALKVELDHARIQIDQLIQGEVDGLMQQFAKEKAAWKSRERERIKDAVSCIVSELENEKRMRKQVLRLNKKLGFELADARAELSKVTRKLESERRAREILEHTCNELTGGIEGGHVDVEELKRESARAREEVEKERQMFQLADVLREERVQMKLAEAKYEFEEKAAALERLRSELEGYFGNSGITENGEWSPYLEPNKEYADPSNKIMRHHQNRQKEDSEGDRKGEEKEEESGDSEAHSFELKMDDENKIYNWALARDNSPTQGKSRRPLVEEIFVGRKSLREKIQWENISLNGNGKGDGDGSNKPRSSAVCPESEMNRCKDEAKRERSGKSLKNYVYPSTRGPPCQGSLGTTLESSTAGAAQSNSRKF